MSWKDYDKNFKEAMQRAANGNSNDQARLFHYLNAMMLSLHEIAGNLDSLVVSYRKIVSLHEEKSNGKEKSAGKKEKAAD